MKPQGLGMLAGSLCLLAACAAHPPAAPLAIEAPADWANGASFPSREAAIEEGWWARLDDPAIDRLVAAAMADNPTLNEAMARIDQARAILSRSNAAQTPRLDGSGNVAQGQQNLGALGGVNAAEAPAASLSPRLSWELDLWGRVRGTTRAAESRLDARTAEAREARLTIAAQVAAGVLRLRACNYSLAVRTQDIVSRGAELDLMRTRQSLGNVAPVDVASAHSNLASAEIDRIRQTEQCTREIDALVAVSGVEAATIRALLTGPTVEESGPRAPSGAQGVVVASVIPAAPPIRPVLPATVLLNHPRVVAAEREATARWSEIAVAKAERMPRVDLVGVLTGQWIRASGTTTSLTTWSIGPQMSGSIFDGGAGAANVRNARARYREAVATLQVAFRSAVQGVEDGLAAQQSAEQRMARSQEAAAAAHVALVANEARWRAGTISRFELEDSRRQFNRAQESAIDAARDHALAWVELIRTSGNAFELAGADPASENAIPTTLAK